MSLSRYSLFFFSFIMASLPLGAEQQRFVHQGANYAYQWQDDQQQTHQLEFQLHSYPNQLTKFDQYRIHNAHNFIVQNMKQELSKIDPKQAKVTLVIEGEQLRYQVSGHDSEELRLLIKKLDQAVYVWHQEYLQQHYYTQLSLFEGPQVIVPDHNRLAYESAEYLHDWIAQSMNQLDGEETQIRPLISYMLSFVQSIPYHTLRSRDGTRGAGYLTPIQVLRHNRGDCDSKTTLLASAIKYRYPRLDVAIIYTPKHALLAINLPPQAQEESVEIKGIDYLLLEPTGPALLPLGQLAPASKQAISSGLYRYQRMDWVPPPFKK